MDKYKIMADLILQSKNAVFLGGAGVSTESGIPDFRSANGLYSKKIGNVSPEIILSNDFFYSYTELFFDFYRNNLVFKNAKPNIAHKFLAKLEDLGILNCIITQNIDGLHQLAGSKNVYELHGSIHSNHCIRCNEKYYLNSVMTSNGIPRCDCGGIIKPDVVLYGEPLPDNVYSSAVKAIEKADLIIIGGTSLNVYPAAYLINYFHGDNMFLFNKTKTNADHMCKTVFYDSIGNSFKEIAKYMDINID